MLAELARIAALPVTRDQIDTIERGLLALPQRQIETIHWLAGGQYFRQITIPADTFATGAVHKRAHVSVMVSGRMAVNTADGMQVLSGYHAWAAPAGTKRIGYAYEDTVWLTVDRTDAGTVEEAEAELFEAPQMLLSRRQVLEAA